jgi:hypothetical protein
VEDKKLLSNKDASVTVARPRTKGVRRPQRAVARWQPRVLPRPGLRRRRGGSAGTAGRRIRRSGARAPRGATRCATRAACGTRAAAWCRSTGRRAAPPSPRVCTPTATSRSSSCAAAGRGRPPPLRATSEGFCLTISLIWRFKLLASRFSR